LDLSFTETTISAATYTRLYVRQSAGVCDCWSSPPRQWDERPKEATKEAIKE
jgi:hypothetical protein